VLDAIGWRMGGLVAYCACLALIALAIATFTRSGIVPLVVLLVNSSVVSVSFLLAKVFPPAKFLPDAAGTQLWAHNSSLANPLSPTAGGLVLAAWTVLALVAGAVVFSRRDA
jgi:ABC-2 type transport system permease protein